MEEVIKIDAGNSKNLTGEDNKYNPGNLTAMYHLAFLYAMNEDILKSLALYNDIIDKMVIIIEIANNKITKNFFTLVNIDN